jgi:hypothetical protein
MPTFKFSGRKKPRRRLTRYAMSHKKGGFNESISEVIASVVSFSATAQQKPLRQTVVCFVKNNAIRSNY